jgi:hypothetical protein
MEIFERDGFACVICKSTTETIVVHHRYYLADLEPWEYENDVLQTFCESCHQDEHEFRSMAEGLLLKALKQSGYGYQVVQVLAQAIINAGDYKNKSRGIMLKILDFVSNEELQWFKDLSPTPQIKGLK